MAYELLLQTEKELAAGEVVEFPTYCRRLKGAMVEKKSANGNVEKQFVRFGNVMYQSLIGSENVNVLPMLDDDAWKTAPRITFLQPVKITYSQYWANRSDNKRANLKRTVKNLETKKTEVISIPPSETRHYLKKIITISQAEVVWYDEEKSKNSVTKVTLRTDRDTPRERELSRKSFELNGANRDVDFDRVLGYIAETFGQEVADQYADALAERLAEMNVAMAV